MSTNKPPAVLDASQYALVAARRITFDSLVWQVPALGLTAQAFLITLAYGDSSSRIARVVAGTLGVVIAGISMQLMAKHRWHEQLDSRLLEQFESDQGLFPVHGHRLKSDAWAWYIAKVPSNQAIERKSFRWWMVGLGLFGVASFVAVVLAVANVAVLSQVHP